MSALPTWIERTESNHAEIAKTVLRNFVPTDLRGSQQHSYRSLGVLVEELLQKDPVRGRDASELMEEVCKALLTHSGDRATDSAIYLSTLSNLGALLAIDTLIDDACELKKTVDASIREKRGKLHHR